MKAAADPDFEAGLRDFDHLLFKHIGAALSNAARSFVMALTHARLTSSPRQGPTRRYFQHINRYSSAFALASDTAMLVLGGDLKRRETLSARLGDVFSYIYLASAVLKHHQDQGLPEDDLPLVEWSCRNLLYHAQEQLHMLLRNFPNRIVAGLLRMCIFPRGRAYFPPSDKLGHQIVTLVTRPTEARERLCSGIYKKKNSGNPLGMLQAALETAEDNAPLSRKLRDALRNDVISGQTDIDTIHAAREAGVLTPEEAELLIEQDKQIMELINVDDFAAEDIANVPAPRPATDTAADEA
jgi:acyl-CoA dehydrogenase